MDLGPTLLAVGGGERMASFESFGRAVDSQWVEDALEATGTATVRRRKLPAEQVVWIVIGMGLFRDRSIQEVVHHLDLVLPASTHRGVVTSSAVVQARDRLGAAPLATLFEQTAAHWAGSSADAHRWRGLSVYGVDGSALRVADTPDNENAFGRPGSSRGIAGYPQLRIVALMVLRSHLLAGLSLGPWSQGEVALAEPLWAQLPDQRDHRPPDRTHPRPEHPRCGPLSHPGVGGCDARFGATAHFAHRERSGATLVGFSPFRAIPSFAKALVARAGGRCGGGDRRWRRRRWGRRGGRATSQRGSGW